MVGGVERAITPEHFGRERDPRRFAPPRDQRSAVLDQLFDAGIRILWPRLDLEHGAAAIGDRGQKIVEKSVADDFPSALARARDRTRRIVVRRGKQIKSAFAIQNGGAPIQ